MTTLNSLRFGVHAGPVDMPYPERRDYGAIRKQLVCTPIVRADPAQVESELARFAAERQVPAERARNGDRRDFGAGRGGADPIPWHWLRHGAADGARRSTTSRWSCS